MNLSKKLAWQHLLVDLQISLAQIGRELGVSRSGVWNAVHLDGSKRIQKYILQKAIQKNIPIPKELSNIL